MPRLLLLSKKEKNVTPEHILKITLRLSAIWLGWLFIRALLITAMIHHRLDEAALVSAVSTCGYLAMALLIWWGAGPLARRLLSGGTSTIEPVTPAGMSARELLSVLTIFVGLLTIFVGALTDGGQYLTMLGMMLATGQTDHLFDASINLPGLVALGKLAVGLTMILTARRTACWILGNAKLAQ